MVNMKNVIAVILFCCIAASVHAQQPPSRLVIHAKQGDSTVLNVNGLLLEIRVQCDTDPQPPAETPTVQAAVDFWQGVKNNLGNNFQVVRNKMDSQPWDKAQLNQSVRKAIDDAWAVARQKFIERSAELLPNATESQMKNAMDDYIKGFRK